MTRTIVLKFAYLLCILGTICGAFVLFSTLI